jgi:hypothetical protein
MGGNLNNPKVKKNKQTNKQTNKLSLTPFSFDCVVQV